MSKRLTSLCFRGTCTKLVSHQSREVEVASDRINYIYSILLGGRLERML